MKIFIDNQYTEDLSQYTDEELKACGTYSREHASKPIVLSNLSLSKNDKGQYVLSFATKNHKYLDIDYNMSTSVRHTGDGKKYGGRGFRISTYEQYPFKDEKTGEKLFDSHISSLDIWLEPETDEEDDLICGTVAILPTKWQYHVAIIPYADIEIFGDAKMVEVVEEGMLYDV